MEKVKDNAKYSKFDRENILDKVKLEQPEEIVDSLDTIQSSCFECKMCRNVFQFQSDLLLHQTQTHQIEHFQVKAENSESNKVIVQKDSQDEFKKQESKAVNRRKMIIQVKSDEQTELVHLKRKFSDTEDSQSSFTVSNKMPFKIGDYLEDFDKASQKGKCKTCGKQVSWGRERVASHKRINCNISSEEKIIFAKRKQEYLFNEIEKTENPPEKSRKIDSTEVTEAVANFFYRTGIPFNIADSFAWKNMVKMLAQGQTVVTPSAKTLSGELLNKKYDELTRKVVNLLENAKNLTIKSDGWTNVRGENIVRFTVKAPGQKSFFYNSIDGSGISKDSKSIFGIISKIIEEIGVEKVSAVVTENATVMQPVWEELEKRFPTISAYGCSAQALNLIIKHISSTNENSKTIKDTSLIIQFVENHQPAREKFDEIRKKIGISTKLSDQIQSELVAAKLVQDAKIALKELANESFNEFTNNRAKEKALNAIKLMESDDYWDRLEKLVEDLEFPSNIMEKLEKDDTPLYLVYQCFGELYKRFENNAVIQRFVKDRWNFLSTKCLGISYMLVPKFAAEGFYVDEDKVNIFQHVKEYAETRFPKLGERARDEMMQFVAKMTTLEGSRRETIFKMDAKMYWTIFGREEYPSLYLLAKEINEMTSSVASERVLSIYQLIFARRRDKMFDSEVEKLAFVYANCALLDKEDQTDYNDIGGVFEGIYQSDGS